MKTFSVFCCLLYATWTEGDKIIGIEGFEGGQVSFQCSHRLASKYNKYFCKDPCTADALATVKSGGRAESERITLVDSGDGVFSVTFSQLKRSDSGTYWCAVARPGLDTYTEVSLTVNEASESTTDPQPVVTNKTTVITDISPTWTFPSFSSSTLSASDLGTSWPTNRSTASNNTHPGEQRMSMSTGTVLYAAAVPVVVLAVLVLATRFRKRREISKPPAQVCSNGKDLISANGGELECEYDDIDKEMQSNKITPERASTAQHIKLDPPALLSIEAEYSIPLHIYENLCCSRATAGSGFPAADHQNTLDISSGIKPLPPIISERTHDDRFRKHTRTPAATGSAMSKTTDIYNSPPSSDPSRSESMPTSLWFGLDLSGIS
uniref:CMRF35-like molecule 1 n=1 Tax=Solea senegalensis TaxID=28829 RepID=UPI001CD8EBA4|nr:CMRF35-like molecule 1 [Solea senegalensis]